MHLARDVREIIEGHAAAVGLPALKRAAAELSEAYRNQRQLRLNTPERVAAYLVTRMPGTYAAAHTVLGEVRSRLAEMNVESVLDVGGGAGAASLAALEYFKPGRLTLLEREPAMAETASEVLPQADIRIQDFTAATQFPPHDLVIASYALGEAPVDRVLERLWQATRVAMVVIEPGSTQGYSTVLEIRSRLLAGGGHIIAPCPGEGACPLQTPDWCHFGARVERGSLHRRLKEGSLNYEDEKFSYLAVGRSAVPLAGGRIIRRPQHQPGLITLETCVPGGLETVRATKRQREVFRAARRAAWGGEWR